MEWLPKNKWTQKDTEVSAEEDDDAGKEVIKAQAHFADEDLLDRSLVGYFAGKEDTPTRNNR